MIRKAVIPAAGLGTRFLPWTAMNAKELIPVIDPKTKKIRAVIDLVVEEAYDANLKSILIISALGKTSVQDHLTKQQTENYIPTDVKLHYIDQKQPERGSKGLGDAISYSKDFIADEDFAVLLGDDFHSKNPVVQLVDAYKQVKSDKFGAIITVLKVPEKQTKRYGIVSNPRKVKNNIMLVDGVVEKPEKAPSNLAITGRYILSSKIFNYIEKLNPGSRGEIELTDAINNMAKDGLNVYCIELDGIRYDAGTPQGWYNSIQDIGNGVYKEQL